MKALCVAVLVLVSMGVAAAETYEYDAAGRLTAVRYPDGARITYVYDANGNVLQVTTSPAPAPPPSSTGPPAAPAALTASLVSGPRVTLAWTDTSPNEARFVIERRAGGGAFTRLATVAADAARFHDDTVALNRTYTYRVRAINTDGASAHSNEASVSVTVGTLVVAQRALSLHARSGSTSSRRLVLRNRGGATLTGTVGAVAAPLAIVSGGGTFSIPPGMTKVVTVAFAPTAAGRLTGSVTITPAIGAPIDVLLTGNAR